MQDSLQTQFLTEPIPTISWELASISLIVALVVFIYRAFAPSVDSAETPNTPLGVFAQKYNYAIKLMLFFAFAALVERIVISPLMLHSEIYNYGRIVFLLVLAFAPLRQILAGFLLSQTKSLRLGELIEMGTTVGTVVSRGLIHVVLKNAQGNMLFVPNSVLLGSAFTHIQTQSAEDTIQFFLELRSGSSKEALQVSRDAAFSSMYIQAGKHNQVLLDDYNAATGAYRILFDLTAKSSDHTQLLKSNVIQTIIDHERLDHGSTA